jgi:polyisoprenoid-binding protein YceI
MMSVEGPAPGRYTLGPDRGRLLLRTYRVGLASKVGHDLVLEFSRWSATVEVPAGDPAGTRLDAAVDLGSLRVLEGTGGVKPLTDGDKREIVGTAAKVLGTGSATFTTEQAEPAAGTVTGRLTLNGVTAPLELTVTRDGQGRYRARGGVTQTRHRIKPYSAFLGALKLRDEVELDIEAELEPAAPAA